MIKVGSDFSGVGAFNQALMRLGIEHEEVFACDMDKYARQTFIHNYGEPKYFPENVYDREIPSESLDIYMTSPPCQAFSLAGKRKGEDDERGILFYNSHEFIRKNKPRYFIFENVKGLLSDDNGRTFGRWIEHLGGKSVNGNPVLFPYEKSVPYHIYWTVLNAKDYNIPQNRERVFIVGIRDDEDNIFSWPKPGHLTKKLKDVLESAVDEKYYLSEKMVSYLNDNKGKRALPYLNEDEPNVNTIIPSYFKTPTDGQYLKTKTNNKRLDEYLNNNEPKSDIELIDAYNQSSQTDISHTIKTSINSSGNSVLRIKSATNKGYEVATDGDSVNLSHPNSETRRGRVGKGVAQTLETSCNQGIVIGAFRGRNPENPSGRTKGTETEQRLEINKDGVANTLTSVQKDNVVVYGNLKGGKWDKTHEQSGRVYDTNGISPTIHTMCGGNQEPKVFNDYRIRKLTPRECFRLMDFPDSFDFSPVSNSQAYEQAGNSICVGVLAKIIEKLNL